MMDKKIRRVLERLEKRARLEKSHKLDLQKDKKMLAITKDTGEFFYKILLSMNASRILELGTSFGYSTLWFAAAIKNNKNAKITTIEHNLFKIKKAQQNFHQAGVNNLIQIRYGDILDILKKMPKKPRFDFVLIDADKENVKKYFELVLPMTKIGGIIATDNMLYPEKYRQIMRQFSQYVAKNPAVCTATLPVGNGQEITIRID